VLAYAALEVAHVTLHGVEAPIHPAFQLFDPRIHFAFRLFNSQLDTCIVLPVEKHPSQNDPPGIPNVKASSMPWHPLQRS
jgi:hypothetical protein